MAIELRLVPIVMAVTVVLIVVPCVFTSLAWVLRTRVGRPGLLAMWFGGTALVPTLLELRLGHIRRVTGLVAPHSVIYTEIGYFLLFAALAFAGAGVFLEREAQENPERRLNLRVLVRGMLGFAAGFGTACAILITHDVISMMR